jgi:heat-inducible transcriptional repressor
VPSDSGYRTYVDHLLPRNQAVYRRIAKLLYEHLQLDRVHNFERLLQRAAKILATISGYVVLITTPQKVSCQIRHVQLVAIDEEKLLLILVTDDYQSQSLIIDTSNLGDGEIRQELELLTNFLNTILVNKTIAELASLDLEAINQELKGYGGLIEQLLKEIHRLHRAQQDSSIMVQGFAEVLRQPEFAELEQVQMLIQLLEQDHDQLMPLIWDRHNQHRVVDITIGAENPLEPMQGCSLISAAYRYQNNAVGKVGMIGPTRMVYEDSIALVESTANYLSELSEVFS